MKTSLNLIFAAFASLLIVSCYPYPENRPHKGTQPQPGKQQEMKKTEAEALKEKQDAEKKKEELKKKEESLKKENGNTSGNNNIVKPPPVRSQYETAKKAPGREGFVLSPYNNKLIDVRGFKPGSLVQDPTYDPSEKKYFRVP